MRSHAFRNAQQHASRIISCHFVIIIIIVVIIIIIAIIVFMQYAVTGFFRLPHHALRPARLYAI